MNKKFKNLINNKFKNFINKKNFRFEKNLLKKI